jgi:hypothetical protein
VVLDTRSRGLAEAAARDLAPERPRLAVDPRAAGTIGGLRVDLARALLALLLERDETGDERMLLDPRAAWRSAARSARAPKRL